MYSFLSRWDLLYPPMDIHSSNNSVSTQTKREQYFSLVRQIRDYLGDEKVDHPDDLVYCCDSKDFRSESKMQQDSTVPKVIRHKPFKNIFGCLKGALNFLRLLQEKKLSS